MTAVEQQCSQSRFANLTASDFEVIRLGYNPSTSTTPALASIGLNPSTVRRTVYERHGYLDRARASRQCGSQLGKCESCGHSADFGNNRSRECFDKFYCHHEQRERDDHR